MVLVQAEMISMNTRFDYTAALQGMLSFRTMGTRERTQFGPGQWEL
jgi:hypothetical protein